MLIFDTMLMFLKYLLLGIYSNLHSSLAVHESRVHCHARCLLRAGAQLRCKWAVWPCTVREESFCPIVALWKCRCWVGVIARFHLLPDRPRMVVVGLATVLLSRTFYAFRWRPSQQFSRILCVFMPKKQLDFFAPCIVTESLPRGHYRVYLCRIVVGVFTIPR